jgi:plasmid stabilization system protein ParE
VPTREVVLHDEAAAEYDAAFEWYLQRSPDAALKFDAEVERAILEIGRAPERWALGAHGVRRFLLRGFPFLMVYRELDAQNIQILAVAHGSRRPRYWKARI